MFKLLLLLVGIIYLVYFALTRKKRENQQKQAEQHSHQDQYSRRNESPQAKVAKGIVRVVSKFPAVIAAVLVIVLMVDLNSVYVSDGEIKHFSRVYGGVPLPVGHYVATKPMTANPFGGMKGPQATVFTPGFKWFPLIDVLYTELDEIEINGTEIDLTKPHSIPANHFAIVNTRDGRPMSDDMILAPKWKDQNEFLDAATFLSKTDKDGNKLGYRGDQSTLVTGGVIMANKILYSFRNYPAEDIKTGEVGVVRSATDDLPSAFCNDNRREVRSFNGAVTYLVPKGCAGVWNEHLEPKTYRFHPKVYTITHVPTRQQDFDRFGGYVKKTVSFEMEDDGKIKNIIGSDTITKPANAEGEAIDVVVEGWTVPIDLKTKYQVVDAPLVVATIGDFVQDRNTGLHAVEQFLKNPIESTFRIAAQGQDIMRCAVYENDVYEGKKLKYAAGTYKDQECVEESRRLFDLINNRAEIESESITALNEFVSDYGLGINIQTMGHPNLPVESLIPRMRANYARQLQNTFKEEQATYEQRKDSEAARVEAENQKIVVTAELRDQAADKIKSEREKLADARAYELKKEGEGMRDRDIEAAKGQRELVAVMGEEKVQEQVLFKMAVDGAVKNPEMVKTATVFVGGDGGESTTAAATLLGTTNNIAQFLSTDKKGE